MFYRPPSFVLSALCAVAACVACDRKPQAVVPNAWTTAEVALPPTDPPVVDKALADRFTVGMPQDDAVAVLQSAATSRPVNGSYFQNVADQARLNGVRYDLTVTQGRRKLVLKFRKEKLVDVQKHGLD